MQIGLGSSLMTIYTVTRKFAHNFSRPSAQMGGHVLRRAHALAHTNLSKSYVYVTLFVNECICVIRKYILQGVITNRFHREQKM